MGKMKKEYQGLGKWGLKAMEERRWEEKKGCGREDEMKKD
jgi:hypothetical protein